MDPLAPPEPDIFQVEVVMSQFVMRAEFQLQGDVLAYLNAPTRNFFRFDNATLLPLSDDYQVPAIKQSVQFVSREYIAFISFLEMEEQSGQTRFLQMKRPVVFYTDSFAIKGDLHVSEDRADDAIFDTRTTLFPLTDATLYPLRSLVRYPSQEMPFLAINKTAVLSYHVQKKR